MGTPARARSGPPRAGGPAPGPPGPGGPRGPPGRGPPGGPPGPPPGPPFWGPTGPIYYYFINKRGSPGGSPGGCPRGGPRGAKKCTFFWVFNNSPSRDKNLGFFHPPGRGQNGGSGGYMGGIRLGQCL